MRMLLYYCCLMLLISCKEEISNQSKFDINPVSQNMIQANPTDIPTVNYQELKPYLHQKDNKIYVVNFWATWCAPWVKEVFFF